MQTKFVHFELNDGYLDNWLLAGPQSIFAEDEALIGEPGRAQMAQRFAEADLGITDLPVERGPATAGMLNVGEFSGAWNYFACQEDHRVDQSTYVPANAYLRSWAYCQLYSPTAQAATLEINSAGPIQIWVNDRQALACQQFAGAGVNQFTLPLALQKGANPLFVRFETGGAGQLRYYFTARLCQPEMEAAFQMPKVYLPTLIKTIGRRNRLEKVFHTLYLERQVYSWEQPIRLNWPAAKAGRKKDDQAYAAIRLINTSGRIYAEAEVDGTPGDQLTLGMAAQFPEGEFEVLMMPPLGEFYDLGLRLTHKVSLWNMGRQQFATTPVGTPESRKQESLIYAARQEQGSLERETARMALSHWGSVGEAVRSEPEVLLKAAERVTQRQESSLRDLLGLLGLAGRFGDHEQFPAALKTALEKAALGLRYDPADAGQDVIDFSTESSQLLAAVCQALAGQRYPEQVFTRSGLTGQALRQRGEDQALAWMRQRAAWGFTEWGSEPGIEQILAGLVCLVDLSETESLWEMASALLDKLFFTLAINMFQGVYGGASSQISPLAVKGGLVSAFSAIARLMWGQGSFSPHLMGLVNLACGQNYTLPAILAEIAMHPPEEMWSKERHTSGEAAEGANLTAYKTPDTMLSSVQSYRPGEPGRGEQVWQATLGPGAVVFTNHPGCSGETEAHWPGYWRGNGVLPRIAQWKDALVCLYRIPEDAALDFTHAYFPIAEFDQYYLKDGWAMARKGNAYLALTAANGISRQEKGPYAQCELRSPGRKNAWFCQMGRAERHGSFEAFQKMVLDSRPGPRFQFDPNSETVQALTLGGERLEFGWQGDFTVGDFTVGDFTVDHLAQPLNGFRHYENTYTNVDFPCTAMEIRLGTQGLRLNFE